MTLVTIAHTRTGNGVSVTTFATDRPGDAYIVLVDAPDGVHVHEAADRTHAQALASSLAA